MKTRKTLISHHGIIEDGVFVAILLFLCHMIVVCQCQRPFTNGSLSQTQQQQNAAIKQQTDVYLYDNDVVRLFDANVMTATNGNGSGSGAGSESSGAVSENGTINARTKGGDGIDHRNTHGSTGGNNINAGNGVYSGFDINYPAVPQSQNGASGTASSATVFQPNRDRKHTFQDLRKNLKEQRKQWDRQGDDPEQTNQNLMKIIKSKIMKSDVSKTLFSLNFLSV